MSEEILDVKDFMERVQNDKDLFFELLDIFINDFQKKRHELEEAIQKRDSLTIEHISHFLKGSCGNISAKSLRVIFHELEKKGNENDVEDTEKYLSEIDVKFQELVIFIDDLRAKR